MSGFTFPIAVVGICGRWAVRLSRRYLTHTSSLVKHKISNSFSWRALIHPVILNWFCCALFLNCDAKLMPFSVPCNTFRPPPEKTAPFFLLVSSEEWEVRTFHPDGKPTPMPTPFFILLPSPFGEGSGVRLSFLIYFVLSAKIISFFLMTCTNCTQEGSPKRERSRHE